MLLWLMSLPAPDLLAGQGCSGASRGPRRWGWYTRPEHLGNRIWGRCMKYTHLENRQCRVKFSCILGFQSIKLTGFYLAEIRMKAPTAVRGGQRGWKRVGWYLTRPRPSTRCEKGTMQLQRVWLGGWRPTKGWSEPSHAPTCDWPTMHSHKPSGDQLTNPVLSLPSCWPWRPKCQENLASLWWLCKVICVWSYSVWIVFLYILVPHCTVSHWGVLNLEAFQSAS